MSHDIDGVHFVDDNPVGSASENTVDGRSRIVPSSEGSDSHGHPSSTDRHDEGRTSRTVPGDGGKGRSLRIQIVSDLIGSPAPWDVSTERDVDLVVGAGDMHGSTLDAIRKLRATFPTPVPIVMVLGDRDLAGGDRVTSIARARTAARDHGVVLLEDEAVVVEGVRFVGATLWTDFRYAGPDGRSIEGAMNAAEASYRALDIGDGRRGRLDTYGSMWVNARSRVVLTLALRESFAGPTVVVTHHAPSALCLGPDLVDDPLAAAYASRCDDLVRSSGAALWIHGHVPDPVDVAIGTTRVVAAPHRPGCPPTIVRIR